MRILIINSEYPPIGGGAGNASANLAQALIAQGQRVAVLTARYKDLPKVETLNGVYVVRAMARRKRADRSLAYEQITFLLGGGLRSIPLVRSWKPDVVVAFFGMPSGGIALGLQVLFRIPFIVSLRGGDVPGFRPYDFAFYHRIIGPILHLIWRRAGAVIANSGGLRLMAQDFDRKVPIQIIPNGVDADLFSPPKRDWDPPKMLFVGRIVYQKGLDLLLHALSTLKDLPWTLTVVGDGPLRPMLEALANRLGIEPRVEFIGWQKGEALVAAYHRANLFPYPSRHEGMPNAVLEAMGSGLPVIASRIAGNEELVIPGETGLLIEPENQQALETALRQLLTQPDRRQAMGQAARARAIHHYPWEKTASEYLEILNRVIAP